MTRRAARRLVGLNVALLAILVVVTLAGARAGAQTGNAGTGMGQAGGMGGAGVPGQRVRGVYTMVSGRIQGSVTNAVYVFDAANQEMVAVQWDRSAKRFDGVGYRSLAADTRQQGQTR